MSKLSEDRGRIKRIAFIAIAGAVAGAVFTIVMTGNPLAPIVGIPLGVLSAVAADMAASRSEAATARHHPDPQHKWRWRVFMLSPLWGGATGFLAFYLMGNGNVTWGFIGIPIGLIYSVWLSRALFYIHASNRPSRGRR